VLVALTV